VGLTFGIVQITLYAMYRKSKPVNDEKLPEHKGDIIINKNEFEPTNDEKKIDVKVDIEIVEKKEEEEEKKHEQVVVTEEKTEEKSDKEKIDDNKKTEEVKSGCEE
jgi:solute carrier family 50 protein (sugar transporter)